MKKKILFLAILIIFVHTLFSCSGGGSSASPDTDGSVSTSVTQTVGTEGGTISSTDGNWQMTIPAGALTSSTQITIKSGAIPSGSIPQGFVEKGGMFRFEPHGLTFNNPVTFRFNYSQGSMDEDGIEERLIAFYYINDNSTVEEAYTVVDTASNTVEVELNHFSFGGPLTMAIRLVNNGIITNPAIVSFISDRVADELRSLPDNQAREQFYQDNAELLAPFMERLDTVLGSNPIAAEFPAVDFSAPGTVSTKPYAVLFGEPSRYTSNNDCYIEIGGNNVVAYQYKIDDGEWSAETDISIPIVQWGFAEGSHTLRVIGENSSGEWQGDPTVWTWHVDCSVPVAGDVTLTGLPADPTPLSSINVSVGGGDFVTYRYRIDEGAWSAETGISSPIELQGLGENRHSLEVIVKDPAGNWQVIAAPFRYEWTTDYTAPGGTFAINNGSETTASQTVTLNLSVNSADEMCFSNDGITYSSWEPYDGTKSWSLSNEYGDKTVYGKFRDRAGHEYQTADGISYAQVDLDSMRMVAWTKDSDVYGRLINVSTGLPWGDEFVVNPSDGRACPSSPQVVISGRKALVVWRANSSYSYGRIFEFTATGVTAGDSFVISSNAYSFHLVNTGDKALVVYNYGTSIFGRIIDITPGVPAGSEFTVATGINYLNSFQVTLSGTKGTVVWKDGQSPYTMNGRVIDIAAGSAVGGVLNIASGFLCDFDMIQLNNTTLVVWAYCISTSNGYIYYIQGRYIDCSTFSISGNVFGINISGNAGNQSRLMISSNIAVVLYNTSDGKLLQRTFDISTASQSGSEELLVCQLESMYDFDIIQCGDKELAVWEYRSGDYPNYSHYIKGRFINANTNTLLGDSELLISTSDPTQQDSIRAVNTEFRISNERNGKIMVTWLSGEKNNDYPITPFLFRYYKIFGHTIDINTMQPESGGDVMLANPYPEGSNFIDFYISR